MAETILQFQDFRFRDGKENIRFIFLKHYWFEVPREELESLGLIKVEHEHLIFDRDERSVQHRLNAILQKGFTGLRNILTGNETVYIHKNSGIPLIGSNTFGLVDRGSSLIEVKPITGCNLDCVYCSVDENRRKVDFVVEMDYLVEELKKIVAIKGDIELEIHLGSQGEPQLYADLVELVRKIAAIKTVKRISMESNGTLLSKKKIDDLVDAGLTRVNLSLNTTDPSLARKIAGKPYNLTHVMEMAKYIMTKCEIVIAPVYVKGLSKIEDIILFGKSLGIDGRTKGKYAHKHLFGIQNYLSYPFGKTLKAVEWEEFFKMLEDLEKKYDVKLKLTGEDFKIIDAPTFNKPFKKDEMVQVKVVCKDRLPGSMLAVAKERTVSIIHASRLKINQTVNVKLIRDKHNIFVAKLLN